MSIDYQSYFSSAIDRVKREGRYRIFTDLERTVGKFPIARCRRTGRDVTVWCANDYLGMGQHPKVIHAMAEATERYGAGSGGTRNISGTHHLLVELEELIGELHRKEAGLVFTSGYVANEAALATVSKLLPDCVIFSDELNHASMIQGMRYGEAERQIFRHNNPEHLEALLKQVPLNRPKLIAFESVYSMDGDIGPINAFCDLAEKYNALTYLDEVHAVGMYGQRGAGVAERDNALQRVSIIQGTLSKAYGIMGGYIATTAAIADAVRSYSPNFIFTTSLPPSLASGAIASVTHLMESQVERQMHQRNVAVTKQKLAVAGIPMIPTESHIIPVLVGDPVQCKAASDMLLEHFNVYAQPINYPTVPRGTERLRLTPTPLHTEAMIDELTSALMQVFDGLKIQKAA